MTLIKKCATLLLAMFMAMLTVSAQETPLTHGHKHGEE